MDMYRIDRRRGTLDKLKGTLKFDCARLATSVQRGAYTQARQALLKPLRDYRDLLEELALRTA